MPGDTKPHLARIARSERRRASQAGTLDDVKGKLWAAIERVDRMAESADDALALKATHAMVQACGAYVKVLEVGELEARLATLEASAPTAAA